MLGEMACHATGQMVSSGIMAKYYYYDGQRHQGPLTAKQIMALSQSGTIQGETQICKEGEDVWHAFDKIHQHVKRDATPALAWIQDKDAADKAPPVDRYSRDAVLNKYRKTLAFGKAALIIVYVLAFLSLGAAVVAGVNSYQGRMTYVFVPACIVWVVPIAALRLGLMCAKILLDREERNQ